MAKGKKEVSAAPSAEIEPGTFQAEIDGKIEHFKVVYPKLHVPGIGIVTADELLQMPEVLAELIQIKSGAIQKL